MMSEKMWSKKPRKRDVMTETTITMIVNITACLLVGQET
jgi:hypothetical protein